MKKILVLGAGYYLQKSLKILKNSGYVVIASDRDTKAPGSRIADRFHAVDIVDREAILGIAEREKVHGIMALSDFGTRSAAHATTALGLPGISPTTAEMANDKGFMRDRWKELGLEQPDYRVVGDLKGLHLAVSELGLPCVIKPTDCGGSGRGISVLRQEKDVEWAYDFARPYVTNGRYIVEQYLAGTEMTIETLSVQGAVHVLAMSDKEKPDLKTRVALSLNYTADMPFETLQKVEELVRRAVLALDVNDGMAHTEVIVTSEGPKLVELGARGGGGHVFHTCIEAASGVCAPLQAARLLTGEEVEIPKVLSRGSVYRFFNPKRGILRSVENLKEAASLPGVLDIGMFKKPGDLVGDLENSKHRAGFVVTEGITRAEAVARADAVEDLLHFEVDAVFQDDQRKYEEGVR